MAPKATLFFIFIDQFSALLSQYCNNFSNLEIHIGNIFVFVLHVTITKGTVCIQTLYRSGGGGCAVVVRVPLYFS